MLTSIASVFAASFAAYRLFTVMTARPGQQNNTAAYAIESKVTHARIVPESATHAFTYPTLMFLVSLNALESHALDLVGGWVFGYGGLFWRLTGLRPSAYMADSGMRDSGIKEKLLSVLLVRGYPDARWELSDAWMWTSPSYMGFEGINPLTVYFCYNQESVLWLVVLEVHNTFGERHAYILEVGKSEDEQVAPGFCHQWTFPRQFHVSPFNDRLGFYTVSVTPPHSAPSFPIPSSTADSPSPPRPSIRIHLHPPSSASQSELGPPPPTAPGPLKLTALLRTTHATPLTTLNLLSALARQPFALFLSFVRILYQAWILHYHKRLDVHVRPEPLPGVQGWGRARANADAGTREADGEGARGGGIGWQKEGWFERYARERMCAFLMRRAEETGVAVELIAADPLYPPLVFRPAETACAQRKELTIWYLLPQFFTTVLLAPSVAHALLLGYTVEKLFVPSSLDLFRYVFSVAGTQEGHRPTALTYAQKLRTSSIPLSLLDAPEYEIPSTHPFDPDPSHRISTILNSARIWLVLALGRCEEWTYHIFRARFIPREEPWRRWHRALIAFEAQTKPEDVHVLNK
ncbi:hypothetical protein WOLCODRAFT_132652 [Wolfiporia cocos MD-104 SS10]|uniref:DUF1365-domain-containing protein n=1 Tax=Wolfiporia cocos (strain MD-104) TaxID=742152 RepID=A0A2H3K226_WOLCO|nr:hypothetical protein WOLCODRAFT_132652 [Wolfiporia cocos MD-104 SS10]